MCTQPWPSPLLAHRLRAAEGCRRGWILPRWEVGSANPPARAVPCTTRFLAGSEKNEEGKAALSAGGNPQALAFLKENCKTHLKLSLPLFFLLVCGCVTSRQQHTKGENWLNLQGHCVGTDRATDTADAGVTAPKPRLQTSCTLNSCLRSTCFYLFPQLAGWGRAGSGPQPPAEARRGRSGSWADAQGAANSLHGCCSQ